MILYIPHHHRHHANTNTNNNTLLILTNTAVQSTASSSYYNIVVGNLRIRIIVLQVLLGLGVGVMHGARIFELFDISFDRLHFSK